MVSGSSLCDRCRARCDPLQGGPHVHMSERSETSFFHQICCAAAPHALWRLQATHTAQYGAAAVLAGRNQRLRSGRLSRVKPTSWPRDANACGGIASLRPRRPISALQLACGGPFLDFRWSKWRRTLGLQLIKRRPSVGLPLVKVAPLRVAEAVDTRLKACERSAAPHRPAGSGGGMHQCARA